MRQLLLLRHAEAEHLRPGQRDFERPLSPHGRAQAHAAAQRLQQLDLYPRQLLSSPAARARETAAIVAAQLHWTQEVQHNPSLYQADVAALLRAVRGCKPSVHTVLLIGHNPGLSELARLLSAVHDAATAPDSADTAALGTAALCRIRFEAASWSELAAEVVRDVAILP